MSTKKFAKITAPSRKPTTLAPRQRAQTEDPERHQRRRRAQLDQTKKAPRIANEAISSRIVLAEPQPTSGAFEIA